MRRWIVAGMLGMLGLAGCTKGADVPENVDYVFAQLYPGAQNVVWEVQGYGYEAVFTENGVEYEAEFSRTGQWIETEYELSAAAFPPKLLKKIQLEHAGAVIAKFEIEITAEGMFFEVEVERGEGQLELYFDVQGNEAKNSNEDA